MAVVNVYIFPSSGCYWEHDKAHDLWPTLKLWREKKNAEKFLESHTIRSPAETGRYFTRRSNYCINYSTLRSVSVSPHANLLGFQCEFSNRGLFPPFYEKMSYRFSAQGPGESTGSLCMMLPWVPSGFCRTPHAWERHQVIPPQSEVLGMMVWVRAIET